MRAWASPPRWPWSCVLARHATAAARCQTLPDTLRRALYNTDTHTYTKHTATHTNQHTQKTHTQIQKLSSVVWPQSKLHRAEVSTQSSHLVFSTHSHSPIIHSSTHSFISNSTSLLHSTLHFTRRHVYRISRSHFLSLLAPLFVSLSHYQLFLALLSLI